MDSPQNRPVRDWLVNHANLVSTIRLPDNLFTDAGTEVGSDLIVLQKNTRKSELTEKERNFIETRLISGSININNSYADLDHIIHTSVSMGKNMYGQPAMNFIHEGVSEPFPNISGYYWPKMWETILTGNFMKKTCPVPPFPLP